MKIHTRVFFGNYKYGFILSFILANIVAFVFMWTQGTFSFIIYGKFVLGITLVGTGISSIIGF